MYMSRNFSLLNNIFKKNIQVLRFTSVKKKKKRSDKQFVSKKIIFHKYYRISFDLSLFQCIRQRDLLIIKGLL